MINLYFLVEGQTEAALYPEWLNYLLPDFKRVKVYNQAKDKNYYLFNAGGFPRIIYTHLPNAMCEVNEAGNYNYLVMCFDADECTVKERKNEVIACLKKKNIELNNTRLVLIVQNCCIETWLLGNRRIYERTPPRNMLSKFTYFYDVSQYDPEKMSKPRHCDKTRQQFHAEYFIKLCRYKKMKYKKGHPQDVLAPSYLQQLQARIDETNHLGTFRYFRDFCQQVNAEVSHRPNLEE